MNIYKVEEYHIFVVWSKGYSYLDIILQEISLNFEIIDHTKIEWSNDNFKRNLERFYGDSLKRVSQKVIECGSGKFDLILVKDNAPKYEDRDTSSGPKIVNSNIFDCKVKCRRHTNAGHLVHSSDDVGEAKFQYWLLTGHLIEQRTRSIKSLKQDTIGIDGWQSLSDIWDVMNEHAEYVVLRNFESLDRELNEQHPDIDMLVTEPLKVARLLGLRKRHKCNTRAQFFCTINGKEVNFDLRTPLDGYYPSVFSYQILKGSIWFGSIRVPNEEHAFWNLMYHAFFHKRTVSRDYITRLHDKSINVEPKMSRILWDRDLIGNQLIKYLSKNYVCPCEPLDQSVYYNFYDFDMLSKTVSKKRIVRQYFYKKLSIIKKRVRPLYVKFSKS